MTRERKLDWCEARGLDPANPDNWREAEDAWWVREEDDD